MKLLVVIFAGWVILYLEGLLYQHFWRKGLSAHLSFVQDAAVEGDTAQLKEIVTNRKFIPLPVLHVKFQMGRYLVFSASNNFKITDQNYRSDIFSCMPWQEIRRTLDFSCRKRGYYQITSISLVSYDLFFLSHCVATLPENTFMYVYPRPADPVRLEMPLKNLLGQILARQALLRDPFETQSVRPYQSYDPYKSVNWKATAHTGELKVNVYTPASSWKVAILLDMESDLIWTDEDLTEESIRLCGSMSEYMIGMGIPVAVYSNGTDCLTGQPSRLEAGAGKEHLRSIMELLARIQVSVAEASAHGAAEILAGQVLPWESSAGGSGNPGSGNTSAFGSQTGHGLLASAGSQTGSGLLAGAGSQTGPGAQSVSGNPGSSSGAVHLANGAKIAGQSQSYYVTMEDLISFLTDRRGNSFASDTVLYVMISPGQRQSLADAFDQLCRQSPGSQWILPCRPDDQLRITDPRFAQFFKWEVPYGHTQII